MNPLGVSVLLPLAVRSFALGPPANDSFTGEWEGQSKCAVPGSACHDEHVVLVITEDHPGGGLKMDGYKIVAGERQFMGTLTCSVRENLLRCTGRAEQRTEQRTEQEDQWVFERRGDSMTGTLTLRTRHELYRKLTLARKS